MTMEPWTMTYKHHVWSDDQVTTAHLVAVAELTGDTWAAMSPWTGPRSLTAWLTVLIASTNGGDLAAAMAEVYAIPASQLTDVLSERAEAPAAPPVAPIPPASPPEQPTTAGAPSKPKGPKPKPAKKAKEAVAV